MVDRWNKKPVINSILDILIKNKGEILNNRLEELLKKEFPFINSTLLGDIFLRLESENIIQVYRVSKSKKMIVLNKYNKTVRSEIMDEL